MVRPDATNSRSARQLRICCGTGATGWRRILKIDLPLLRPQLGNIDLQSFHRSTEAIRAGREAATRELPRLQAVLG